jgi:hypothetical protein
MSLADIFVAEHKKPPQSVTLAPSSCANCSKPLYVKLGHRTVCPPCSKAFEHGAQVWVCMTCETARKWGEGQPEDKIAKRLRCNRCCKPTEHQFFEVSRGYGART